MTSTAKLLLVGLCMAVYCVQQGDAWWSWSWGRHTVTVRPGWRGGPSIGARWTFSRHQPNQNECKSVDAGIIRRHEWGAQKPRAETKFLGQPNEVFVYHTGAGTCDLLKLSGKGCAKCLLSSDCLKDLVAEQQEQDQDSGLADIKYNFMIGEDGLVYEGRGWELIGDHTDGKDQTSIGIGFLGNFDSRMPNQAGQDALNNLLVCGKRNGKLSMNAPITTDFRI